MDYRSYLGSQSAGIPSRPGTDPERRNDDETPLFVLLFVAALGLVGCGDDDDLVVPVVETLELSFSGLEPLMNDYHYEGWAIIDGAPVTTGKFNVDAGGDLVTPGGAAIASSAFNTGTDLSGASAIVITIEPAGDIDAIPAATHILAGPVSGGSAPLTVGDGAALGSDFLSASGDFILATPTNGDDSDENSGIWFLSLETGAPAAGLSLPTLPAGWAYEGWAVIDGQPVTTGTFVQADAADDDAPFSGFDEPGPPFPGEDFLQNAPAGLQFPTDLAGATAVISVEPEPDDAPAPFTLKPLVGGIPEAAADHVTYPIANNAGGFPTGTAVIR